MQRHKAGVLREEAKAALEEETLARLVPLVLEAAGTLPDAHGVQSCMSCLAHLVDKATPALLHAALFDAPADTAAAAGGAALGQLAPNALALCSLLQHAVGFLCAPPNIDMLRCGAMLSRSAATYDPCVKQLATYLQKKLHYPYVS